jgi:PEP-CTERM motif
LLDVNGYDVKCKFFVQIGLTYDIFRGFFMFKTSTKLAVAALFAVSGSSQAATTILSESFNGVDATYHTYVPGDLIGGSYTTYFNPGTVTNADNVWNVTGVSVDAVQFPAFGAIGAPVSLELSGSPAPGGISYAGSAIKITSGNTYTLTFAYAGDPGSLGNYGNNGHVASTAFDVTWNGGIFAVPSNLLAGNTAGNVSYFTSSFTAVANSTLNLSIYSSSLAPAGTVIDDIRVESMSPVPEPSQLAMMFAGVGAVLAIARRRRQQV